MTAKFAIILAAGQGTRMKSKLYKVLHPTIGNWPCRFASRKDAWLKGWHDVSNMWRYAIVYG